MRFRAVGNLTFAVSLAGAVIGSGIALAMAQQTKDVPSIIDVQLHALHADSFGSPTPPVCGVRSRCHNHHSFFVFSVLRQSHGNLATFCRECSRLGTSRFGDRPRESSKE